MTDALAPAKLPGVCRRAATAWREVAESQRTDTALRGILSAEGLDPDEAAADNEANAARIAAADLYWTSRQMTQLALAASADLPEWTPAAAMPSPVGLIVWDGGLPEITWGAAPEGSWRTNPLGVRTPPSVPVDAALWVSAGGRVRVHLLTRTATIERMLTERWRTAPLFMLSQTLPLDVFAPFSTTGVTGGGGNGLIHALGASWLLMSQPTLAETSRHVEQGRHARSARRRGKDPASVRIIELRRAPGSPEHGEPAGAARQWHHQWVVSGHWRQQAYGPGRAQRRPVYIPSYVKGPPGAPLLVSDRVHVWRR